MFTKWMVNAKRKVQEMPPKKRKPANRMACGRQIRPKKLLGFLCSGLVIGVLVDELEEFAPLIFSGERVSDLLPRLGLARHLHLANVSIGHVDMRSSLQIVKLHVPSS
jgi:hypothetical protein